jgi:hypothetical protein
MRYPGVQVRNLLRQIEQGSIDLNHLAREINLLSLDELRQLGREFLKQGDAWTGSVDLVRAELAVRRSTRGKKGGPLFGAGSQTSTRAIRG